MSEAINQIITSLDIIYNSASTNLQRHEAQEFLESIKQLPDCPFWGFQLALIDNNYNNIVRHYALNLLLHSITHDFEEWDGEKRLAVRNWIVELSTKVSPNDPHYIKTKIAFLWTEMAKRCWGECLTSLYDVKNGFTEDEKAQSWMSMDSNLLELWNHSEVTRDLSLLIFKILFEDIYLLDDPIVAKRKTVLVSLCPEIVVSEQVLSTKFEPNDTVRMFAASTDGWLIKWCKLLDECIQTLAYGNKIGNDNDKSYYLNLTIKILEILKNSLFWILPLALREVNIIPKLFELLTIDHYEVKLLTIECFDSLYNRPYSSALDNEWLVQSVFNDASYEVFYNTFKSIQLDSEDIDDNQYRLTKKIVEFLVILSDYMTSKNSIITENTDYTNFYKLLAETTKHSSLSVSGISLQFWCTMLRNDELSDKPDFETVMPQLLETCANGLVNYSDCDKDSVPHRFLEVDFDNPTDQATFLNEYRKLNEDIVRIIVCKKPKDALLWLANKLNTFFSSPLGTEGLNNSNLVYKGAGSEAYLYSYAQLNIIEACVRGISRWQIWYKEDDAEEIKQYLTEQIDNLCKLLINLEIKNPVLARKKIQTLVQFTSPLKDVTGTVFQVLEKVIESCTFPYPENATEEEMENIRDLRASSGTELNRLAYLMPESLKNIYGDLEVVINRILSENDLISHERIAFKSFLLVVSQRSSLEGKEENFKKIVDPELLAWTDPVTIKGLTDLHWFMERLGIVKIAEYFRSRGITADTDLFTAEMDDQGRQLKKELKDQWYSVFPIRATRILIQYSIEKLDHSSETYQYLLKMLKPRVIPILPHILQLLYQIQAYHNPANWTGLPEEVQAFVKCTTMERFWHQGISIQSKQSFVDENVKAMHTLRDFADSVGHSIRYTREYAYLMISTLSELEETIYEDVNNAVLLWRALTSEYVGITLHSWRHMINVVVRNVIKNCPTSCFESFMVVFLPMVFGTLKDLLVQRWAIVYEKGLRLDGNESDEQLSEEMLEEHMLRQLTQVIDRMIIDIVGQTSRSNSSRRIEYNRIFILTHMDVFAPFVKLLCSIISFRDTKCTFNALLVLRYLANEMVEQNNSQIDSLIYSEIFPSLVNVLCDKFYADAHSEAAYSFMYLYVGLRSRSEYPLEMLSDRLGGSAKHLKDFEEILSSCSKAREKKNCVLKLFAVVRDDGTGDTFLEERGKMIAGASRNRKKNTDDGLDNGGLGSLFGNEE